MDANVCCTNPKCGRPSRLGSDALGRTFRCMSCGSKLPRCSAGSAGEEAPLREQSQERGKPWELERVSSRRSLGIARPTRVGRFHVLSQLGSGSSATVYRAFDPDL